MTIVGHGWQKRSHTNGWVGLFPCSYYYWRMLDVHPVLGSVEVAQLTGPILPHEHILVDFSRGMVAPPAGLEWLVEARLTMANLGKIRRYPWAATEEPRLMPCRTQSEREACNYAEYEDKEGWLMECSQFLLVFLLLSALNMRTPLTLAVRACYRACYVCAGCIGGNEAKFYVAQNHDGTSAQWTSLQVWMTNKNSPTSSHHSLVVSSVNVQAAVNGWWVVLWCGLSIYYFAKLLIHSHNRKCDFLYN